MNDLLLCPPKIVLVFVFLFIIYSEILFSDLTTK